MRQVLHTRRIQNTNVMWSSSQTTRRWRNISLTTNNIVFQWHHFPNLNLGIHSLLRSYCSSSLIIWFFSYKKNSTSMSYTYSLRKLLDLSLLSLTLRFALDVSMYFILKTWSQTQITKILSFALLINIWASCPHLKCIGKPSGFSRPAGRNSQVWKPFLSPSHPPLN
jgi:hypothetical protein